LTTNVMYDHPGPKARIRNLIYSIVFAALLVAAVWWMIAILAEKGQLTAEKWKPLVEAQNWTTYLLPGLWNTIKAAVISVVIALPLGAVLGVARMSEHAWIRQPASVIVEFFRSIPVIILMVFAFQLWFSVVGSSSPLAAVVIGLVLYNGSVLAEVFRAGVRALPKGQTEAAMAIGLRKTQVMTSVLLPQALTAMLPAIVSQLVVILKDTALGGILVGYVELRRAAATSASNYQNLLPTYVLVSVIYIVLNLTLTTSASMLERRFRRGRRGGHVVNAVAVGSVVGEIAGDETR
jgi:glutamate transport system permease protein